MICYSIKSHDLLINKTSGTPPLVVLLYYDLELHIYVHSIPCNRSRRGRIFRSGVCFDAPSHIPYVFVARVVNKIHNVNIGY